MQPECSKLFPFALSQLHPWSAQITGKITKETFILEIAKHFLILNQKSKFRFVRKSCTDWKCLNTPIVDFPESLFLESSTDYHPSKRIMAMLTNIYQFHNRNGYFEEETFSLNDEQVGLCESSLKALFAFFNSFA